MNKLTYKEAYNKIIDAYFKDEIKPYNGTFCFCGTLIQEKDSLGRVNANWGSSPLYSGKELAVMEAALLRTLREETIGGDTNRITYSYYLQANKYYEDHSKWKVIQNHENYENALFLAMSNALDELKKIHVERGENVEELPILTKRKLEVV